MIAGVRIEESIVVAVSPRVAFELWTTRINDWWRRGTRYWNDARRAVGLRFEPRAGGRFIEIYDAASGEGFEIGRVTAWEPGSRLAFTWRQADWGEQEQLTVEVRFEASGDATRVVYGISGWEKIKGGEETFKGYSMGMKELLGWYQEAARR